MHEHARDAGVGKWMVFFIELLYFIDHSASLQSASLMQPGLKFEDKLQL
jgi:hypothetical protein